MRYSDNKGKIPCGICRKERPAVISCDSYNGEIVNYTTQSPVII